MTVHVPGGGTTELARDAYWKRSYERLLKKGIDEANARRAATAVVSYLENLEPKIEKVENLSRSRMLEGLRADRFTPKTDLEEFLRTCLSSMTIVAGDLVDGAEADDQVAMVEVGLLERLRDCLLRWRRVFDPASTSFLLGHSPSPPMEIQVNSAGALDRRLDYLPRRTVISLERGGRPTAG